MQVSTLNLPPQYEPRPTDHPKEQHTLSNILDLLEFGVDPVLVVRSTPDITEWIAWQLGICVEYYHQQQHLEFAVMCGVASIVAADGGNWPERSAANRNSLAITMLMMGNTKFAKNLCEDALIFAGPHRHTVYASLHSLLGYIEMKEGNSLKAVRHYDSLFRILKSTNQGDAIRKFARTALIAYEAASDNAGLVWCLATINGEDKARLALNEIFSHWGSTLTTENMINTVTRLHAFGLHNIAAEIEERFHQIQKDKENDK